mgnify:CR=1 FL=1
MNNLTRVFLISLISIILISCEKEEDIRSNEVLNSLSYLERIENINELNKSFLDFNDFIKSKKSNLNSESKTEQSLTSSIVLKSKVIFDQLGIEEHEIDEISNGNTDEVYVAFAIALISAHNKSDLNNEVMMKADFLDCLGEATGVNALIALGDSAYALYAGEVSAGFAVDTAAAAAFRRSAMKAATKIIARTAGGFGAIVMLAEFTICMSK